MSRRTSKMAMIPSKLKRRLDGKARSIESPRAANPDDVGLVLHSRAIGLCAVAASASDEEAIAVDDATIRRLAGEIGAAAAHYRVRALAEVDTSPPAIPAMAEAAEKYPEAIAFRAACWLVERDVRAPSPRLGCASPDDVRVEVLTALGAVAEDLAKGGAVARALIGTQERWLDEFHRGGAAGPVLGRREAVLQGVKQDVHAALAEIMKRERSDEAHDAVTSLLAQPRRVRKLGHDRGSSRRFFEASLRRSKSDRIRDGKGHASETASGDDIYDALPPKPAGFEEEVDASWFDLGVREVIGLDEEEDAWDMTGVSSAKATARVYYLRFYGHLTVEEAVAEFGGALNLGTPAVATSGDPRTWTKVDIGKLPVRFSKQVAAMARAAQAGAGAPSRADLCALATAITETTGNELRTKRNQVSDALKALAGPETEAGVAAAIGAWLGAFEQQRLLLNALSGRLTRLNKAVVAALRVTASEVQAQLEEELLQAMGSTPSRGDVRRLVHASLSSTKDLVSRRANPLPRHLVDDVLVTMPTTLSVRMTLRQYRDEDVDLTCAAAALPYAVRRWAERGAASALVAGSSTASPEAQLGTLAEETVSSLLAIDGDEDRIARVVRAAVGAARKKAALVLGVSPGDVGRSLASSATGEELVEALTSRSSQFAKLHGFFLSPVFAGAPPPTTRVDQVPRIDALAEPGLVTTEILSLHARERLRNAARIAATSLLFPSVAASVRAERV